MVGKVIDMLGFQGDLGGNSTEFYCASQVKIVVTLGNWKMLSRDCHSIGVNDLLIHSRMLM